MMGQMFLQELIEPVNVLPGGKRVRPAKRTKRIVLDFEIAGCRHWFRTKRGEQSHGAAHVCGGGNEQHPRSPAMGIHKSKRLFAGCFGLLLHLNRPIGIAKALGSTAGKLGLAVWTIFKECGSHQYSHRYQLRQPNAFRQTDHLGGRQQLPRRQGRIIVGSRSQHQHKQAVGSGLCKSIARCGRLARKHNRERRVGRLQLPHQETRHQRKGINQQQHQTDGQAPQSHSPTVYHK